MRPGALLGLGFGRCSTCGAAESRQAGPHVPTPAHRPPSSLPTSTIPPTRHNQLSGPLPAKIGNPKVLLLGYNTFTSSIPSSWGYDLKRVELLNLE